VFSEIIPKTLGTYYWRQLAPITAFILRYMILLLYPFVKLSELITHRFNTKPNLTGFSREEFVAMTELSSEEGQLGVNEAHFLKSLLLLRSMKIKDAMTPRIVMFSLSEEISVETYFHKYDQVLFSRIPIYKESPENIVGYVFRSDLLLAQGRSNGHQPLKNYLRNIPIIFEYKLLKDGFRQLVKNRAHIMLVVDEYGSVKGLITLEDVIETALGVEIVDEKDKAIDMQKEAKKLWEKRMKDKGININE
jgi:CBS domain containing-hemolysin-like protein